MSTRSSAGDPSAPDHDGSRRSAAGDQGSPRVGAIDLAEFEARLRRCVDRAKGSLGDQSEAIESVLQMAERMLRDNLELTQSNRVLETRLAKLGVDSEPTGDGSMPSGDGPVDHLVQRTRRLEDDGARLAQERNELTAVRAALEQHAVELTEQIEHLQSRLDQCEQDRDRLQYALDASESRLAAADRKARSVGRIGVEVSSRVAGASSGAAPASAAAGSTGDRELLRDVGRAVAGHRDAAAAMLGPFRAAEIDPEQRHALQHGIAAMAARLDLLHAMIPEVAPVETQAFEIAELVTQLVEDVRPIAAARGLELSCRIDPALPSSFVGHPRRVRQLLTWALDDAIRFSAGGELIVMATVQRATDAGLVVRLSAVNDGSGLTGDGLDRILGRAPLPEKVAPIEERRLQRMQRLAAELDATRWIEPVGKQGFAVCVRLELEHVEAQVAERRHTQRLLQEMLQSSLGPVVDLSDTGMRVVCSKRVKNDVVVEIADRGAFFKLRAAVVWCRKIDRRHFEAGLRFVKLTPVQREQLHIVAQRFRVGGAAR